MLAAERQSWILQHLEERGRISIAEITRGLGVSPATARRDLALLQRAGLLRRVHGGAVVQQPEIPQATSEDLALAEEVYRHLHPGDTVAVAGETLAPLVARRLLEAPLRLLFITNHLEAAHLLRQSPSVEILLLGGRLHRGSYTLPLPSSTGDLKLLVTNQAFVEVEGLEVRAGISSASAAIAQFERELLNHALHKVVVSPARRLGILFPHRVLGLSEVDLWITTHLSPEQCETISPLVHLIEANR